MDTARDGAGRLVETREQTILLLVAGQHSCWARHYVISRDFEFHRSAMLGGMREADRVGANIWQGQG